MIGGFYNWHLAFEGEFKRYNPKVESELEKYDILFVGLSRPELEGALITRLRNKIGPNSKTKIVVCIDYAIELWQDTFQYFLLQKELVQADLIFTSEPMMNSWVSALINDDSKVHHIVHPSNLDAIRHYAKPYEERTMEIASILHRYDNYWTPLWLATKDLPYNNTVVLLDPNVEIKILPYFAFTKHGFKFTHYLDWVSRHKVVVDSYHRIHTYGRTAVDNASLDLPTVGADWTYSQKKIWPDLCVSAGDVWKQKKLIQKLMEEESFYFDCIEKAREAVQFYSYENRKNELLNKLYN